MGATDGQAWSETALSALRAVPAEIRAGVAEAWDAYLQECGAQGLAVAAAPDFQAALFDAWAHSLFLAQSCARHPRLLEDLLGSGDLLSGDGPLDCLGRLRRWLHGVTDSVQLSAALRQFRRREMVRIGVRDLTGWAPLEETLCDLSLLAEACLDESVRVLHVWAVRELGEPRSEDGTPQQLVVLGMGKLGARELNFSSDIDLILAFPQAGHTDGQRSRSNEEFFAHLGRGLVEAMGAVSAEGFVFRTDLRLRPFGEAGPLAMSFAAMEAYYQSHAREWERYAMVKARPVAGDLSAGEQLLGSLRPFVYRRYLDYGAFESLREMKALIAQQLNRKGMGDNVKLGLGGIREIEFIGQAFQLIRGGREEELQERGILRVLALLGERGYLPAQAVAELVAAYRFLRLTENRLQAIADQQVHVLPDTDADRLRIARAMGHGQWSAFFAELQAHRLRVQHHFENVIEVPEGEQEQQDAGMSAVWQGSMVGEEAAALLAEAGYGDTQQVLARLGSLRASRPVRHLSRRGQARLDRLLPAALRAIGTSGAPDETLRRVLGIVEGIVQRSSYVALLADRPMALRQLVRLSEASPWIVRLLARYPLLLDELLDARRLYAPLDRPGLERELNALLERADQQDLEQQMELLRQFAHSNGLRVAAADVTGALPLMKVSDHLTVVAEVVLQQVLQLALKQLAARYGSPRCVEDGRQRGAGFCIVAYGKLGGIELGYGSDLDLVFLHDSVGEQQHADGQQGVDNATYFVRAGQRVIHMLNTQTMSGVLYEVDMRLRPSGNSGLLVTSIGAFEGYQREQAWTWEHQALVRARVVAGDAVVARHFEDIRRAILCQHRDPVELCREVLEMRERMRAELDTRAADVFDLKQGAGGIADIEFMVQYGALRWAHAYPELIRYTDNIRILDSFADAGVMDATDRDLLNLAYRRYREEVHRATLQDRPAQVPARELAQLSAAVQGVWARWMQPD
jgi:glutamate-ammonia-ligase adenylyltransferase